MADLSVRRICSDRNGVDFAGGTLQLNPVHVHATVRLGLTNNFSENFISKKKKQGKLERHNSIRHLGKLESHKCIRHLQLTKHR